MLFRSAWLYANPDQMVPRIGNDFDKAMNFLTEVSGGLMDITLANPKVLAAVVAGPPTPEQLKGLMQGLDNLSPVVGYKEQVTGFKDVMDSWRTLSQKAFRFIGTNVEDSLVRGPFYAKRYATVQDELLTSLKSQFADEDSIPLELLDGVQRVAHRRALKDTKAFLYTIDRRTNLGK